jgi:hypothetical protein
MRKKKTYFLLILLLVFSNHIISLAQVSLSKPRLELEENKLIIGYDILNSQPADTFITWIEVTDKNGNIIKATALSGDFGEKIRGGMNKKIIWDLNQDNIVIEENIFVEVMAEKKEIPEVQEEPMLVETVPVSNIKTVSKKNMIMSSMVLPGWGQSKVKKKRPYWLISLPAYGCLTGSIILNRMGVSTYDDYLFSADTDERNILFDKSVKQDHISEYLAFTAAGIWTINLIWVIATPGSPEEQIVFQKNNSIKIKPGYDPYLNCKMLTLSYRF